MRIFKPAWILIGLLLLLWAQAEVSRWLLYRQLQAQRITEVVVQAVDAQSGDQLPTRLSGVPARIHTWAVEGGAVGARWIASEPTVLTVGSDGYEAQQLRVDPGLDDRMNIELREVPAS